MQANAPVQRGSFQPSAHHAVIAEIRRFYCELLSGREVRRDEVPRGSSGSSEALWFIVGRQCIAVWPLEAEAGSMSLQLDDPIAVAERCWDAGYTVCAFDTDRGDTKLSVIDPVCRRIELTRADEFRSPRFTQDHNPIEVTQ